MISNILLTYLVCFLFSCTKSEISDSHKLGAGPMPDGDYYVAPWGNDADSGSFDKPWATWQKAFNTALPGNVVYFRGGVYYPRTFAQGNNITIINPRDRIGHNGEPGNPICYYNYPGETPILDCRNMVSPGTYPSNRYMCGLIMYDVHWINWRGLTIRNVYQREGNVSPTGIAGYPISNMTFDRMVVHNIGGCGWYMENDCGFFAGETYGWDDVTYGYVPYDTTAYINCDTYQCCDTLKVNDGQTPGNLSDGFKTIAIVGTGSTGGYLSYEGCRAWHCGDDGFDLPTSVYYVKFNRNWSFNHVYPDFGAEFEGNGLKILGGTDLFEINSTTKLITNCIFAWCDLGLYTMTDGTYMDRKSIINNTIAYCYVGIQMRGNTTYERDSVLNTFKNNIIFGTKKLDAGSRPYNLAVTKYYKESNNTWDFADSKEIGSMSWWKPANDLVASDDDFVSLAPVGLSSPRKTDGSLPEINFLKLVKGSDLTGLGYSEKSPNL